MCSACTQQASFAHLNNIFIRNHFLFAFFAWLINRTTQSGSGALGFGLGVVPILAGQAPLSTDQYRILWNLYMFTVGGGPSLSYINFSDSLEVGSILYQFEQATNQYVCSVSNRIGSSRVTDWSFVWYLNRILHMLDEVERISFNCLIFSWWVLFTFRANHSKTIIYFNNYLRLVVYWDGRKIEIIVNSCRCLGKHGLCEFYKFVWLCRGSKHPLSVSFYRCTVACHVFSTNSGKYLYIGSLLWYWNDMPIPKGDVLELGSHPLFSWKWIRL